MAWGRQSFGYVTINGDYLLANEQSHSSFTLILSSYILKYTFCKIGDLIQAIQLN